jgi:hypothetical protein
MAQGTDTGSFVPTTFIWDAAELQHLDVTSDRFKELLVRLYQNLNLMQLSLNVKDSAYYDQTEFVNGQSFFPSEDVPSTSTDAINRRQAFRKVINFGALPNTSTKNVAHEIDITSGYSFTRIYGCASDTTNLVYQPIPNANSDIHLRVTSTNVVITTSSNLSSYDTTYVVLEYLKQ